MVHLKVDTTDADRRISIRQIGSDEGGRTAEERCGFGRTVRRRGDVRRGDRPLPLDAHGFVADEYRDWRSGDLISPLVKRRSVEPDDGALAVVELRVVVVSR